MDSVPGSAASVAAISIRAYQGVALTFGDTDDGGFGFRLADAFRISGDLSIPVGDYHFRSYSASFNSNRSRAVSGNLSFDCGAYHG